MKHAVITDTAIITLNNGQATLPRQLQHITDLEHIGQRTGINQFWIMPGTQVDNMGHDFFTEREGYNIFQTANKNGSLFARPQSGRCRKDDTRAHEIRVIYPARGGFSWDVKEPLDVLTTVDYLESTLKVPVQWSPAHMSHVLLRESVTKESWLDKSSIALDTLPFNKAAKDIRFIQPLSFDMVGQYLHQYDRNAAYLAACQGVTVGCGTPIHEQGTITDFARPGVYHVARLDTGSWDNRLPPIVKGDWITSDILQFALKNGYQIDIDEAWIFEEGHGIFRKWASALWEARAQLKTGSEYPHETGRKNAIWTTKSIATQGMGKFAMKGVQHSFMRNNWWADVVGKNRMNTLHHIKKYAALGYYPQFVKCDAVWYVSPVKNPVEAVPGIMERCEKLGGFKHAYTLLLTREIVQQSQQHKGDGLLDFLKECVKQQQQ